MIVYLHHLCISLQRSKKVFQKNINKQKNHKKNLEKVHKIEMYFYNIDKNIFIVV